MAPEPNPEPPVIDGWSDVPAPTPWQLSVFIAAVELRDWALVEQRLGVDRYRCRKALDRLGHTLNVAKLLPRVGDHYEVTGRDERLAKDARALLAAFEALRDGIEVRERVILLRFAGYPAQIKRFAAQAVGEFERDHPLVRVEFHDLAGSRRRGGGVRSATQLRDRELDMVIAAADFDEEAPEGLLAQDLYGWRLMAATDPARPLVATNGPDRLADVSALAGRRLLVSPKGHRSRDLLDLFAAQSPPWEVVGEDADPELLVRMAMYSDKVAVVPSDSVPAPDSSWPVLVSGAYGALGGKYRVMWRGGDTDPERLRWLAQDLADRLVDLSRPLRGLPGGSLEPTRAESQYGRD